MTNIKRAAALATVLAGVLAPDAAAQVKTVSCGKLPSDVKQGRDVSCGLVTVPLLHRSKTEKRTIQVAVSLVKADKPGGHRPLIVFSGGPGEAIAGFGPQFASKKEKSTLARLNEDRDLVLIDQRGAGASKPSLTCEKEENATAPALNAATTDPAISAVSSEASIACAERLRVAGVDLGSFTTAQIAQDFNTVRRALDLERVDFFATSYGTKVALAAARRDSSGIGRIVLSSTVDARGGNLVRQAPANFALALKNVNRDCAADTACKKKYGNLETKLEAALESLEAQPLTGPSGTPASARRSGAQATPPAGGGGTATFTAGRAALLIYESFYNQQSITALGATIDAIAERDPSLLDTVSGGDEGPTDSPNAVGQEYSVLCSEELAGATEARLRAGFAGLGAAPRLFGEYQTTFGVPAARICRSYAPRPQTGGPGVRSKPIKVPVLVVSGQFDQVTPAAYGQDVARSLPDARHIVLPTGHSPVLQSGACGLRLLRSFLDASGKLPLCDGKVAK